jgi:23S rRNA pseudouridine2605 synthase
VGAESSAGVRLQRVMAEAGVASRRECEQMIVDGRVEVNGHAVTELPVFVDPRSDRISVDGRFLRPAGGRREKGGRHERFVYVMLNKPDNTLGTTRDQLAYDKGGRRTVADLVKHQTGARLYPVGRLDFHSTGLVLMTNDGVLADRLTHARYGVTKTYRVWIHGRVPEEILDMLRRRVGRRDAVDAEGRPTGGVRVIGDESDRMGGRRPPFRAPRQGAETSDEAPGARAGGPSRPSGLTVIEIEVRTGKTEPLEEMLVTAGCRVKRVARVAIGPLRLMGVRPGDWRDLTKDELRSLREAAGLTARGAVRPKPGAEPGPNPKRELEATR